MLMFNIERKFTPFPFLFHLENLSKVNFIVWNSVNIFLKGAFKVYYELHFFQASELELHNISSLWKKRLQYYLKYNFKFPFCQCVTAYHDWRLSLSSIFLVSISGQKQHILMFILKNCLWILCSQGDLQYKVVGQYSEPFYFDVRRTNPSSPTSSGTLFIQRNLYNDNEDTYYVSLRKKI